MMEDPLKAMLTLSALRGFDDILRRVQGHQIKKRAMLRELHLAHLLSAETND